MFSEKIHRYIYLFGLLGLGFGMMVGTVPTSIPQLILSGNWLLEGDFRRKWERLKKNPLFWTLAAVYLIHVAGLSYTEVMPDGLKDVRTKMPLLVLPLLIFSSRPLSIREFHGILYCFIAGSLVNTAWCMIYSFVLHTNELVRNASRFMSHIRLGLYLNIAIATCVYFAWRHTVFLRRAGFLLLAGYFVAVLYILGLASGLVNFMILFLLFLLVIIYRQGLWLKLGGLVVLLGFFILVGNYVYGIASAQLAVKPGEVNVPQALSPSGRPYMHFDTGGQKENGYYVQINIQPAELQQAWKQAFPEDSFSYAPPHNLQRYEVLIRYMASRGLNKDSAGMAALDRDDLERVRRNMTHYQHQEWSYLHKRIYELVNEYDEFVNHRFVNGHSLTMRLYFWKAACELVKEQGIFGVGTGDVQQELNRIYRETDSPLEEEWYKRPHNQYLTILVALGIPGLLIFLWSLVWPPVWLGSFLPKLYWPFLIVALISFLMEDTLETQAGLTFYAFFNTLFLAVGWSRRSGELSDPDDRL